MSDSVAGVEQGTTMMALTWIRTVFLISVAVLAGHVAAQGYPAQPVKLAGQSAIVQLKAGAEFAAFIAAEKTKWDAVIKASGAKID